MPSAAASSLLPLDHEIGMCCTALELAGPHISHGELHFLQKQNTSAFVAHVNMFHPRPTTPPTPQRTVFKLPSSESIKALGKPSYYIGYMFLQQISCCQCLARRPAPCDSILPQPRSTLDCAAAAAPGATSPRLERLPRLHSPLLLCMAQLSTRAAEELSHRAIRTRSCLILLLCSADTSLVDLKYNEPCTPPNYPRLKPQTRFICIRFMR